MEWDFLDRFRQHIVDTMDEGDGDGNLAIDAGWTALAADAIVDTLFDRDMNKAQSALEGLGGIAEALTASHDFGVENTSAFVAGRLTGLTDVLAAASERRVPDHIGRDVEDAWADPKYNCLLAALYSEPHRTTDLARAIGETEASTSRKLRKLRDSGLVTASRKGREVYSELTVAAKYYVDQFVEAKVPEPSATPTPIEITGDVARKAVHAPDDLTIRAVEVGNVYLTDKFERTKIGQYILDNQA
jgi:DNA-binding transcriptional ArsR family regulator